MIKFKESYAKSRYDFKDKMKAVIDTIYGTKEANNLKGLVGSVVVHFVQCELLGSMLIDVATLTDRGTNVFANKYISKDRILGYKKELTCTRAACTERPLAWAHAGWSGTSATSL